MRQINHTYKMLRYTLLFCLVASCYGASTVKRLRPVFPSHKIVGGQSADISQLPHQLSLEYLSSHICGASIISQNIAISAGHCIVSNSPSAFRIRAGTSRAGSGGSIHQVSRILIHPDFDGITMDYDVSLLFVATPFSYDNTRQPISITTSEPLSGSLTVSGWGATSEGGSSPSQLQAVTIPVVSRSTCNSAYAAYGGITSRMFCAGSSGHDSCQGDSGGPIITGNTLVGTVSWGVGCARPDYPGVYSNLANSEIRNWISDNAGV